MIFQRMLEEFSKRFKKVNITSFLWLLIPLCFLPMNYAHAYLDPGTGSYAVQIIIGVLFGAAYAVKTFSGRIVQYIRGKFGYKRGKRK